LISKFQVYDSKNNYFLMYSRVKTFKNLIICYDDGGTSDSYKDVALFNAPWGKDLIEEQNQDITSTISYPNPAKSIINLIFNLKQSAVTSINLFDNMGNKFILMNERFIELGKHSNIFDLSNYPTGNYTLQIISGDNFFTTKIIINK
jgi:hypothetical protein